MVWEKEFTTKFIKKYCSEYRTRNGQKHRENDLPAVEWKNGTREWWQCGKRHRLTGPAILHEFNSQYEAGEEYWVYGVEIKDIPENIKKDKKQLIEYLSIAANF